MAVRLTRAESAALTRRRLLEAAQRVFFERGFHGASLEAVAEEAGLTKGAVYSRFASKADLFLAYQEQRNERTIERAGGQLAKLEPGDWPPEVIIEHWRNRLLREPQEQSLLVIEFWASACRDPDVQRRFSAQHERLLQRVAEDLDAAAHRLGVTLPLDALELVRLSTGIAHGLTLEQLMNREAVGADMIDLAFAPMQRPSTRDSSSASTARTKARTQKRRANGHTPRDRGR
jgi:AcrR family transcriptional regulator